MHLIKNKSKLKTDSGLPKNNDFDLDKEQSNKLVDIFTTAEYLKYENNYIQPPGMCWSIFTITTDTSVIRLAYSEDNIANHDIDVGGLLMGDVNNRLNK